ncbi:unnamed protein product [Lepidochelys olivacea]
MPRAGIRLEEERLAGRALLRHRRTRCCRSDARLHPGLIGASWWSGLLAPVKWAFAYGRLPETPAGGTLPGGLWPGGPPPHLAHSQRPHGESEDPVGSGPAEFGPGQHPGLTPPFHWQGWTVSPEPRPILAPGAGRQPGKAPRSGEADLSSVKTPPGPCTVSIFVSVFSD